MSFGLGAQRRVFGLVVKRDYIDRPFEPFPGAAALARRASHWPAL
jgi:hypothetical protein